MQQSNIQYHAVNVSHKPSEIHESFHVTVGDEGELFIAIGFSEIKNEVTCKNILYSTVQTIQNALFSNTSKGLYDRFEEAIKQANAFLTSKDLAEIGSLHVAVGLLEENMMYLTKSGLAEVYLLRNRLCTNVTASFEEEETEVIIENETEEEVEVIQDVFTSIATGELSYDDIILLSSTRITKYVPEQELTSLFGKANLEIGFINLEHKLKEDPMADVALLGFLYAQEEELPSESGTLSTRGNMARVARGKAAQATGSLLRRMKSSYSSVREGGLSFPAIKQKSAEFIARQKLYFQKPEYKVKYITLAIVLVLIVLVLSISSSIGSKQASEYRIEVVQRLNEAKQEVSDAQNKNIKGDREGARENLERAKRIAIELKSEDIAPIEISELLEKIEKEEDAANKITRVSTDTEFINLSDKIEGETPKGIVHFDEKLYVYSSSSIFGPFVNSTTNANKQYPVDTNNLITDVHYFDDIRGLILKLTPDKVVEFINNSFKYIDTTSTTWKSGTSIGSFNSNIYILGDDQIWKYIRNRSNYRGPSPWLQKADNDLKNAVSFTIDGGIYVLLKDGRIKFYFQGKEQQDFKLVDTPSDVLENVTDQSKIMTRLGWNNVFVQNQNRILLFTKTNNRSELAFNQQFGFNSVEILSFAVSADERTIFVLGNDLKIYKIDM